MQPAWQKAPSSLPPREDHVAGLATFIQSRLSTPAVGLPDYDVYQLFRDDYYFPDGFPLNEGPYLF